MYRLLAVQCTAHIMSQTIFKFKQEFLQSVQMGQRWTNFCLKKYSYIKSLRNDDLMWINKKVH